MAPIGIAILGSGNFVRDQHKPAVEACKDLILKAVYSRSKASATALLEASSNIDIYSDDSEGKGLDELLSREDIKAVIIALPIPVQPDVIKKSLLAGKHVLSEKPIAGELSLARELITWRHSNIPSSTIWSVAENMRFQDTWRYAASQIQSLGRVLSFRADIMLSPGGKTLQTEWRKKPTYQGGYLLDGGVHFTAILQILLGGDRVNKVAAFTSQLQEHLPPVDTMDAIMKTEKGVTGTFVCSFGMTAEAVLGLDYVVACEGGVVTASRGKVVVKKGEDVQVKEFPEDGSGVEQEVKGFAEAIVKGVADERQTPELAYRDLDLIENMLRSGEQDGKTLSIAGEF